MKKNAFSAILLLFSCFAWTQNNVLSFSDSLLRKQNIVQKDSLLQKKTSNNLPAKPTKLAINWLTIQQADALLRDTAACRQKFYFFFDTDWCSACRMMEMTTFEDEEVVNYLNSNFYCVKFNAELLDIVQFDGKKYGKTTHKNWQCNAFPATYLGDYFAFPSHLILEQDGRKMSAAAGAKTAYEMMLMLSYFNEYHFITTDISTYSSTYEPPSWKGKKGGRAGTNRRRN
jgi:thioredoxin-related protein